MNKIDISPSESDGPKPKESEEAERHRSRGNPHRPPVDLFPEVFSEAACNDCEAVAIEQPSDQFRMHSIRSTAIADFMGHHRDPRTIVLWLRSGLSHFVHAMARTCLALSGRIDESTDGRMQATS